METIDRDERLAEVLAWVSLGLGVALAGAPGLVNRLAGIRDDETTRLWQRAVGLRELTAFALIKAGRPRAALPVWTRVAGDTIDLTLLGLASRSKLESAPRLAAATANVAAITALDVFVALRLTADEDDADDLLSDPAYEPPEPFKGIKGG